MEQLPAHHSNKQTNKQTTYICVELRSERLGNYYVAAGLEYINEEFTLKFKETSMKC